MIQIIDGYLKARLAPRGVRVRSDALISTGISKPSLLDWRAQARRQAARKPDVVGDVPRGQRRLPDGRRGLLQQRGLDRGVRTPGRQDDDELRAPRPHARLLAAAADTAGRLLP
jgi:hypothetical protein